MSSFGESLDPPPEEEPPPQAVAASARDMVTAPTAAALMLRMAPGSFRESVGSPDGGFGGVLPEAPHGLI
ncbi:hypothetical protein GCM10023257_05930 [Streptomyces hyderabadensis]|uniref:Uncharacterized protein n=1 Tax=Streptomyces hyderabadensis TaxID=598549 RepID=A0ABP9HK53_9ACTN